jgi:hypothetical protein
MWSFGISTLWVSGDGGDSALGERISKVKKRDKWQDSTSEVGSGRVDRWHDLVK